MGGWGGVEPATCVPWEAAQSRTPPLSDVSINAQQCVTFPRLPHPLNSLSRATTTSDEVRSLLGLNEKKCVKILNPQWVVMITVVIIGEKHKGPRGKN